MNYSYMKKYIYFLFLIVLLVLSIAFAFLCRNSNVAKDYRKVKRHFNTRIILPDSSIVSLCGSNKTIHFIDLYDRVLKITTFINGKCSSCMERLKQWDTFLEKNDLNNKVSLLIFVNSDNYEQIEFYLRLIDFNYPII